MKVRSSTDSVRSDSINRSRPIHTCKVTKKMLFSVTIYKQTSHRESELKRPDYYTDLFVFIKIYI